MNCYFLFFCYKGVIFAFSAIQIFIFRILHNPLRKLMNHLKKINRNKKIIKKKTTLVLNFLEQKLIFLRKEIVLMNSIVWSLKLKYLLLCHKTIGLYNISNAMLYKVNPLVSSISFIFVCLTEIPWTLIGPKFFFNSQFPIEMMHLLLIIIEESSSLINWGSFV